MQYQRLGEITREARGEPVGSSTYKWCWLLMKHQGILLNAAAEAGTRFKYSVPTLQASMQKAAVPGATPGDSAWAGNLIPDAIHNEWVVKQNSQSAYGAFLQRAVRVPFATRTIVDSGDATAGFVGPGRAIPLARLSIDGTTQLPRLKVGVAVAFSKELATVWSPATAANIEDRMDTATTRGIDQALLDPSVAEVQDRNPASLLNGISQLSSAGTSAANMATDVKSLAQPHLDGGADPKRLLIVAHPLTALAQSLSDNQTFKDMGATGGSIGGIAAVSSVSSKTTTSPTERILAVIDCSKVIVADDGAVEFSASDKGVLQMSDDPNMSVGSPDPVSVVSMFQTETISLKIVRYLNFKRVTSTAATWMTVAY